MAEGGEDAPQNEVIGTMAEDGEDAPKNEVIDEDVLIPCEFCDMSIPIWQLILHQSGCGAEQINVSKGKRREATHHQRSEVTTGNTSEHQNKNLQEVQDHSVRTKQRIMHETTDFKKTSDNEAQQKKVSKAEGREADLHQRSQVATGNISGHEKKSMQEVQGHSVKTEQRVTHEATDLKKTSSAYDDDDFSDDDNNPENETVEHYIRRALATAESLRKARYKSEEVGLKFS